MIPEMGLFGGQRINGSELPRGSSGVSESKWNMFEAPWFKNLRKKDH